MIKLIVTDMDGTLLNSDHKINDEFWKVYDKIKEKNIKFCVASGRQYHNLVENFKNIQDELIYIAENGSYVSQNNKEVFSKTLDKNAAFNFVKISRGIKNSSVVLCGKSSAYIEDSNPDFVREVEKYYHKYEVVDNLLKVEDEILKVAIYDFECSEKNSYPYFKEYEKNYKVIVSAKHWLDIMDPDINKGIALRYIQEELNITKEETLAFGDYMNDYEMLQEATYSYAMKNAHNKLKEIANYEAPSNDDNGVVSTIKSIFNL